MSSIPSDDQAINPQPPPIRVASQSREGSDATQPDARISLDHGMRTTVIEPEELLDQAIFDSLVEAVAEADQTIVSPWPNVISLGDNQQDRFIELVARADGRLYVRIDADTGPVDPFAAMEHHPPTADDIAGLGRWRRMAVGLAGILCPNAEEAAADRIRQWYRDNSLTAPLPQVLHREIRDAGEQFGADRHDNGEDCSPACAAEAFLDSLRDAADGEDRGGDDGDQPVERDAGSPPFRYFQDEFFRYEGTHWKRIDEKNLTAQVVRHLQDLMPDDLTDSFIRSVITNLKGMTLLSAWERQMPLWIESHTPIVVQERRQIAFRNGLLNLDAALAGEPATLLPHDPRWFSTVSLPFNFSPGAECPLWISTLDDILASHQDGDQRLAVLQEFIGLTLVSGEHRFEKFIVLIGVGANGKSTVLRIWMDLLGHDNVSNVPIDALGSDFRLYDMHGRLANIALDMRRMDKLEEGRLKELTSGEPIQVNRKYKSPLTMRPSARLVFATNDMPQISDRTDGIWRRLIAMPFFERFSEDVADRQRATRLRDELPGIFSWALAGAIRLFLQDGFTHCTVCEQFCREHRRISDPVAQFFDEQTACGPNHTVLCQELYDAYRRFCECNGRQAKSSSELGKHVTALDGVTRRRRGTVDNHGVRQYEYVGIGVNRMQPLYPAGGTLNFPSMHRRNGDSGASQGVLGGNRWGDAFN